MQRETIILRQTVTATAIFLLESNKAFSNRQVGVIVIDFDVSSQKLIKDRWLNIICMLGFSIPSSLGLLGCFAFLILICASRSYLAYSTHACLGVFRS